MRVSFMGTPTFALPSLRALIAAAPDDFPKTAMEFDERFATEEACRAYLIRLR